MICYQIVTQIFHIVFLIDRTLVVEIFDVIDLAVNVLYVTSEFEPTGISIKSKLNHKHKYFILNTYA